MKFFLILFYIFFTINFNTMANEQNRFSIILNPLGYTPLSAIIVLEKTNTIPITIIVQGKVSRDSIATTYPVNYGTQIPIHGLYQDYTNKIIIRYNNSSQTHEIITAKIDIRNFKNTNTKMTIKSIVNKNILPPDSMFDYNLYFSSFPNGNEIIGFDKKGDIRYLYNNNKEKPVVMRMEADSRNVCMLYISNNKMYIKRDLLGNIIFNKEYDVHHESVNSFNGREIILGNSQWGWEDMVFELDENKNIIRELSIGNLIKQAASVEDQPLLKKMIYDDENIYTNKGKAKRIDWAHANSLVYDKDNDRLYLSLRHLGLLAIKFKEWKLEWFLVNNNLKTEEGVGYGKKPKSSLYLVDIPSLQKFRMATTKNYGPQGQHALFLKKNGNIILFDNRSKGRSNPIGSRILEYSFNHQTKKAKVVREFLDKKKSYSQYVGDIDLSGSNLENWLIFYGHSHPRRILELSPNNKILFDMEIRTSGMFYRIDKFPLYPYRNKRKKYSVDFNEEILPNQ